METINHSNQRLATTEWQLADQRREIFFLKRRRLDSAGNAESTATNMCSSSTSTTSSRPRERDYSASADSSQEEAHQSTLDVKGAKPDDLPADLKDPGYLLAGFSIILYIFKDTI